MRIRSLLITAIASTALLSSHVSAHEHVFTAVLDGPSEAPANASPGTGFATVTLDLDLITMRVEATFTDLTGTTTASHIHGPTAVAGAGTAGVMTMTPSFTGFPLGVTSGSIDQTYDLTTAAAYNPAFITASGGTVSDALNNLINTFESGKAYLNIHTTTFGGGEIRGFLIEQVPEPTSFAALGATAVGVLARRRR
ncbi:MAG: CHRD domain-containing protein [Tepidisphaeraceae bacterium]